MRKSTHLGSASGSTLRTMCGSGSSIWIALQPAAASARSSAFIAVARSQMRSASLEGALVREHGDDRLGGDRAELHRPLSASLRDAPDLRVLERAVGGERQPALDTRVAPG